MLLCFACPASGITTAYLYHNCIELRVSETTQFRCALVTAAVAAVVVCELSLVTSGTRS